VLATAEQLMRDEGAIVSLVRTNRPEVLAQAGWTTAEPHGYSQANSRDILSHMNMQAAIRRPGGKQFHVRMWRHFELEALMPVYRAAAHERWGTVARGQPYWHWLLTRKAHDQVIVAIEGPDPIHELIDQFASHDEHRPADAPVAAHLMPQIVAYAVVQGSRVVEMFCRPGYDVAGPLVLARACRDAIEQDHHAITLHTAADDPMHELLVTAGGTWCTNAKSTDGVLMIKLLDPSRWTEQMYPLLHHRAKQSGVTRPLEIGFSVGARRFRFRLTRRSSRFESSTAAADDVRCRPGAVEAMMLGTSTVAQLVDAGQIVVRRDELLEPLTALFPSQLYWQSPFDLLRF
jgi:predicted acetyltransferase